MHGAELFFAQERNTVKKDSNSVGNVKDPTDFKPYNSEVELKTTTNTDGAIFKLWAKATKTGLTIGEVYKELAFRTVLGTSFANIRGSDSSGGVSATTEFPASWYDDFDTSQSSSGYWVSWHVLKSFQWKGKNSGDSWDSGSNEVTKPGSYDYYGAAEVDGGDDSGDSGNTGSDVTITVSWTANYNVWDANAYVYAWVWNGPNGDKFVSCSPDHNGSKNQVTFVLPAGYKSFKLVRLSENTPDWSKRWNESSNVDNVSGTSHTVTF